MTGTIYFTRWNLSVWGDEYKATLVNDNGDEVALDNQDMRELYMRGLIPRNAMRTAPAFFTASGPLKHRLSRQQNEWVAS